MRQTKIIATIGPATSGIAVLRDLIAAGVDVARLNFSHGTHESHAAVIRRVREAAADARRCVAILQDLGGPKIRTGTLVGGRDLDLAAGDELVIEVGDFAGGPGRVSTSYAPLVSAVRRGDTLLLDDGRIQLRVEDAAGTAVRTQVVDGGRLGEHKGINAPGVPLPAGALTDKDVGDLQFGVAMGVEYVAVSFVRDASDMSDAREALRAAGAPRAALVAKLERPEAVERLDRILHESDAVMVARGDLGLELPLERVPGIQKEVTRRARALGVPVIVATQVFESMRTEPRPTRAEVSDAANAVDDRVDAIMLAGETAVGAHPVRAVQTLDRVIREAEAALPANATPPAEMRLLAGHAMAICEAAVTLADRAKAGAIVALTRGGKTARALSALRPRAPIFAATDQPGVASHLTLWWGVVPLVTDVEGDLSAVASRIGGELVARGAVARGSDIVVVSVTPDPDHGPSNFLKLQRV
jgi:pyruvate kinase